MTDCKLYLYTWEIEREIEEVGSNLMLRRIIKTMLKEYKQKNTISRVLFFTGTCEIHFLLWKIILQFNLFSIY